MLCLASVLSVPQTLDCALDHEASGECHLNGNLVLREDCVRTRFEAPGFNGGHVHVALAQSSVLDVPRRDAMSLRVSAGFENNVEFKVSYVLLHYTDIGSIFAPVPEGGNPYEGLENIEQRYKRCFSVNAATASNVDLAPIRQSLEETLNSGEIPCPTWGCLAQDEATMPDWASIYPGASAVHTQCSAQPSNMLSRFVDARYIRLADYIAYMGDVLQRAFGTPLSRTEDLESVSLTMSFVLTRSQKCGELPWSPHRANYDIFCDRPVGPNWNGNYTLELANALGQARVQAGTGKLTFEGDALSVASVEFRPSDCPNPVYRGLAAVESWQTASGIFRCVDEYLCPREDPEGDQASRPFWSAPSVDQYSACEVQCSECEAYQEARLGATDLICDDGSATGWCFIAHDLGGPEAGFYADFTPLGEISENKIALDLQSSTSVLLCQRSIPDGEACGNDFRPCLPSSACGLETEGAAETKCFPKNVMTLQNGVFTKMVAPSPPPLPPTPSPLPPPSSPPASPSDGGHVMVSYYVQTDAVVGVEHNYEVLGVRVFARKGGLDWTCEPTDPQNDICTALGEDECREEATACWWPPDYALGDAYLLSAGFRVVTYTQTDCGCGFVGYGEADCRQVVNSTFVADVSETTKSPSTMDSEPCYTYGDCCADRLLAGEPDAQFVDGDCRVSSGLCDKYPVQCTGMDECKEECEKTSSCLAYTTGDNGCSMFKAANVSEVSASPPRTCDSCFANEVCARVSYSNSDGQMCCHNEDVVSLYGLTFTLDYCKVERGEKCLMRGQCRGIGDECKYFPCGDGCLNYTCAAGDAQARASAPPPSSNATQRCWVRRPECVAHSCTRDDMVKLAFSTPILPGTTVLLGVEQTAPYKSVLHLNQVRFAMDNVSFEYHHPSVRASLAGIEPVTGQGASPQLTMHINNEGESTDGCKVQMQKYSISPSLLCRYRGSFCASQMCGHVLSMTTPKPVIVKDGEPRQHEIEALLTSHLTPEQREVSMLEIFKDADARTFRHLRNDRVCTSKLCEVEAPAGPMCYLTVASFEECVGLCQGCAVFGFSEVLSQCAWPKDGDKPCPTPEEAGVKTSCVFQANGEGNVGTLRLLDDDETQVWSGQPVAEFAFPLHHGRLAHLQLCPSANGATLDVPSFSIDCHMPGVGDFFLEQATGEQRTGCATYAFDDKVTCSLPALHCPDGCSVTLFDGDENLGGASLSGSASDTLELSRAPTRISVCGSFPNLDGYRLLCQGPKTPPYVAALSNLAPAWACTTADLAVLQSDTRAPRSSACTFGCGEDTVACPIEITFLYGNNVRVDMGKVTSTDLDTQGKLFEFPRRLPLRGILATLDRSTFAGEIALQLMCSGVGFDDQLVVSGAMPAGGYAPLIYDFTAASAPVANYTWYGAVADDASGNCICDLPMNEVRVYSNNALDYSLFEDSGLANRRVRAASQPSEDEARRWLPLFFHDASLGSRLQFTDANEESMPVRAISLELVDCFAFDAENRRICADASCEGGAKYITVAAQNGTELRKIVAQTMQLDQQRTCPLARVRYHFEGIWLNVSAGCIVDGAVEWSPLHQEKVGAMSSFASVLVEGFSTEAGSQCRLEAFGSPLIEDAPGYELAYGWACGTAWLEKAQKSRGGCANFCSQTDLCGAFTYNDDCGCVDALFSDACYSCTLHLGYEYNFNDRLKPSFGWCYRRGSQAVDASSLDDQSASGDEGAGGEDAGSDYYDGHDHFVDCAVTGATTFSKEYNPLTRCTTSLFNPHDPATVDAVTVQFQSGRWGDLELSIELILRIDDDGLQTRKDCVPPVRVHMHHCREDDACTYRCTAPVAAVGIRVCSISPGFDARSDSLDPMNTQMLAYMRDYPLFVEKYPHDHANLGLVDEISLQEGGFDVDPCDNAHYMGALTPFMCMKRCLATPNCTVFAAGFAMKKFACFIDPSSIVTDSRQFKCDLAPLMTAFRLRQGLMSYATSRDGCDAGYVVADLLGMANGETNCINVDAQRRVRHGDDDAVDVHAFPRRCGIAKDTWLPVDSSDRFAPGTKQLRSAANVVQVAPYVFRASDTARDASRLLFRFNLVGTKIDALGSECTCAIESENVLSCSAASDDRHSLMFAIHGASDGQPYLSSLTKVGPGKFQCDSLPESQRNEGFVIQGGDLNDVGYVGDLTALHVEAYSMATPAHIRVKLLGGEAPFDTVQSMVEDDLFKASDNKARASDYELDIAVDGRSTGVLVDSNVELTPISATVYSPPLTEQAHDFRSVLYVLRDDLGELRSDTHAKVAEECMVAYGSTPYQRMMLLRRAKMMKMRPEFVWTAASLDPDTGVVGFGSDRNTINANLHDGTCFVDERTCVALEVATGNLVCRPCSEIHPAICMREGVLIEPLAETRLQFADNPRGRPLVPAFTEPEPCRADGCSRSRPCQPINALSVDYAEDCERACANDPLCAYWEVSVPERRSALTRNWVLADEGESCSARCGKEDGVCDRVYPTVVDSTVLLEHVLASVDETVSGYQTSNSGPANNIGPHCVPSTQTCYAAPVASIGKTEYLCDDLHFRVPQYDSKRALCYCRKHDDTRQRDRDGGNLLQCTLHGSAECQSALPVLPKFDRRIHEVMTKGAIKLYEKTCGKGLVDCRQECQAACQANGNCIAFGIVFDKSTGICYGSTTPPFWRRTAALARPQSAWSCVRQPGQETAYIEPLNRQTCTAEAAILNAFLGTSLQCHDHGDNTRLAAPNRADIDKINGLELGEQYQRHNATNVIFTVGQTCNFPFLSSWTTGILRRRGEKTGAGLRVSLPTHASKNAFFEARGASTLNPVAQSSNETQVRHVKLTALVAAPSEEATYRISCRGWCRIRLSHVLENTGWTDEATIDNSSLAMTQDITCPFVETNDRLQKLLPNTANKSQECDLYPARQLVRCNFEADVNQAEFEAMEKQWDSGSYYVEYRPAYLWDKEEEAEHRRAVKMLAMYYQHAATGRYWYAAYETVVVDTIYSDGTWQSSDNDCWMCAHGVPPAAKAREFEFACMSYIRLRVARRDCDETRHVYGKRITSKRRFLRFSSDAATVAPVLDATSFSVTDVVSVGKAAFKPCGLHDETVVTTVNYQTWKHLWWQAYGFGFADLHLLVERFDENRQEFSLFDPVTFGGTMSGGTCSLPAPQVILVGSLPKLAMFIDDEIDCTIEAFDAMGQVHTLTLPLSVHDELSKMCAGEPRRTDSCKSGLRPSWWAHFCNRVQYLRRGLVDDAEDGLVAIQGAQEQAKHSLKEALRERFPDDGDTIEKKVERMFPILPDETTMDTSACHKKCDMVVPRMSAHINMQRKWKPYSENSQPLRPDEFDLYAEHPLRASRRETCLRKFTNYYQTPDDYNPERLDDGKPCLNPDGVKWYIDGLVAHVDADGDARLTSQEVEQAWYMSEGMADDMSYIFGQVTSDATYVYITASDILEWLGKVNNGEKQLGCVLVPNAPGVGHRRCLMKLETACACNDSAEAFSNVAWGTFPRTCDFERFFEYSHWPDYDRETYLEGITQIINVGRPSKMSQKWSVGRPVDIAVRRQLDLYRNLNYAGIAAAVARQKAGGAWGDDVYGEYGPGILGCQGGFMECDYNPNDAYELNGLGDRSRAYGGEEYCGHACTVPFVTQDVLSGTSAYTRNGRNTHRRRGPYPGYHATKGAWSVGDQVMLRGLCNWKNVKIMHPDWKFPQSYCKKSLFISEDQRCRKYDEMMIEFCMDEDSLPHGNLQAKEIRDGDDRFYMTYSCEAYLKECRDEWEGCELIGDREDIRKDVLSPVRKRPYRPHEYYAMHRTGIKKHDLRDRRGQIYCYSSDGSEDELFKTKTLSRRRSRRLVLQYNPGTHRRRSHRGTMNDDALNYERRPGHDPNWEDAPGITAEWATNAHASYFEEFNRKIAEGGAPANEWTNWVGRPYEESVLIRNCKTWVQLSPSYSEAKQSLDAAVGLSGAHASDASTCEVLLNYALSNPEAVKFVTCSAAPVLGSESATNKRLMPGFNNRTRVCIVFEDGRRSSFDEIALRFANAPKTIRSFVQMEDCAWAGYYRYDPMERDAAPAPAAPAPSPAAPAEYVLYNSTCWGDTLTVRGYHPYLELAKTACSSTTRCAGIKLEADAQSFTFAAYAPYVSSRSGGDASCVAGRSWIERSVYDKLIVGHTPSPPIPPVSPPPANLPALRRMEEMASAPAVGGRLNEPSGREPGILERAWSWLAGAIRDIWSRLSAGGDESGHAPPSLPGEGPDDDFLVQDAPPEEDAAPPGAAAQENAVPPDAGAAPPAAAEGDRRRLLPDSRHLQQARAALMDALGTQMNARRARLRETRGLIAHVLSSPQLVERIKSAYTQAEAAKRRRKRAGRRLNHESRVPPATNVSQCQAGLTIACQWRNPAANHTGCRSEYFDPVMQTSNVDAVVTGDVAPFVSRGRHGFASFRSVLQPSFAVDLRLSDDRTAHYRVSAADGFSAETLFHIGGSQDEATEQMLIHKTNKRRTPRVPRVAENSTLGRGRSCRVQLDNNTLRVATSSAVADFALCLDMSNVNKKRKFWREMRDQAQDVVSPTALTCHPESSVELGPSATASRNRVMSAFGKSGLSAKEELEGAVMQYVTFLFTPLDDRRDWRSEVGLLERLLVDRIFHNGVDPVDALIDDVMNRVFLRAAMFVGLSWVPEHVPYADVTSWWSSLNKPTLAQYRGATPFAKFVLGYGAIDVHPRNFFAYPSYPVKCSGGDAVDLPSSVGDLTADCIAACRESHGCMHVQVGQAQCFLLAQKCSDPMPSASYRLYDVSYSLSTERGKRLPSLEFVLSNMKRQFVTRAKNALATKAGSFHAATSAQLPPFVFVADFSTRPIIWLRQKGMFSTTNALQRAVEVRLRDGVAAVYSATTPEEMLERVVSAISPVKDYFVQRLLPEGSFCERGSVADAIVDAWDAKRHDKFRYHALDVLPLGETYARRKNKFSTCYSSPFFLNRSTFDDLSIATLQATMTSSPDEANLLLSPGSVWSGGSFYPRPGMRLSGDRVSANPEKRTEFKSDELDLTPYVANASRMQNSFFAFATVPTVYATGPSARWIYYGTVKSAREGWSTEKNWYDSRKRKNARVIIDPLASSDTRTIRPPPPPNTFTDAWGATSTAHDLSAVWPYPKGRRRGEGVNLRPPTGDELKNRGIPTQAKRRWNLLHDIKSRYRTLSRRGDTGISPTLVQFSIGDAGSTTLESTLTFGDGNQRTTARRSFRGVVMEALGSENARAVEIALTRKTPSETLDALGGISTQQCVGEVCNKLRDLVNRARAKASPANVEKARDAMVNFLRKKQSETEDTVRALQQAEYTKGASFRQAISEAIEKKRDAANRLQQVLSARSAAGIMEASTPAAVKQLEAVAELAESAMSIQSDAASFVRGVNVHEMETGVKAAKKKLETATGRNVRVTDFNTAETPDGTKILKLKVGSKDLETILKSKFNEAELLIFNELNGWITQDLGENRKDIPGLRALESKEFQEGIASLNSDDANILDKIKKKVREIGENQVKEAMPRIYTYERCTTPEVCATLKQDADKKLKELNKKLTEGSKNNQPWSEGVLRDEIEEYTQKKLAFEMQEAYYTSGGTGNGVLDDMFRNGNFELAGVDFADQHGKGALSLLKDQGVSTKDAEMMLSLGIRDEEGISIFTEGITTAPAGRDLPIEQRVTLSIGDAQAYVESKLERIDTTWIIDGNPVQVGVPAESGEYSKVEYEVSYRHNYEDLIGESPKEVPSPILRNGRETTQTLSPMPRELAAVGTGVPDGPGSYQLNYLAQEEVKAEVARQRKAQPPETSKPEVRIISSEFDARGATKIIPPGRLESGLPTRGRLKRAIRTRLVFRKSRIKAVSIPRMEVPPRPSSSRWNLVSPEALHPKPGHKLNLVDMPEPAYTMKATRGNVEVDVVRSADVEVDIETLTNKKQRIKATFQQKKSSFNTFIREAITDIDFRPAALGKRFAKFSMKLAAYLPDALEVGLFVYDVVEYISFMSGKDEFENSFEYSQMPPLVKEAKLIEYYLNTANIAMSSIGLTFTALTVALAILEAYSFAKSAFIVSKICCGPLSLVIAAIMAIAGIVSMILMHIFVSEYQRFNARDQEDDQCMLRHPAILEFCTAVSPLRVSSIRNVSVQKMYDELDVSGEEFQPVWDPSIPDIARTNDEELQRAATGPTLMASDFWENYKEVAGTFDFTWDDGILNGHETSSNRRRRTQGTRRSLAPTGRELAAKENVSLTLTGRELAAKENVSLTLTGRELAANASRVPERRDLAPSRGKPTYGGNESHASRRHLAVEDELTGYFARPTNEALQVYEGKVLWRVYSKAKCRGMQRKRSELHVAFHMTFHEVYSESMPSGCFFPVGGPFAAINKRIVFNTFQYSAVNCSKLYHCVYTQEGWPLDLLNLDRVNPEDYRTATKYDIVMQKQNPKYEVSFGRSFVYDLSCPHRRTPEKGSQVASAPLASRGSERTTGDYYRRRGIAARPFVSPQFEPNSQSFCGSTYLLDSHNAECFNAEGRSQPIPLLVAPPLDRDVNQFDDASDAYFMKTAQDFDFQDADKYMPRGYFARHEEDFHRFKDATSFDVSPCDFFSRFAASDWTQEETRVAAKRFLTNMYNHREKMFIAAPVSEEPYGIGKRELFNWANFEIYSPCCALPPPDARLQCSSSNRRRSSCTSASSISLFDVVEEVNGFPTTASAAQGQTHLSEKIRGESSWSLYPNLNTYRIKDFLTWTNADGDTETVFDIITGNMGSNAKKVSESEQTAYENYFRSTGSENYDPNGQMPRHRNARRFALDYWVAFDADLKSNIAASFEERWNLPAGSVNVSYYHVGEQADKDGEYKAPQYMLTRGRACPCVSVDRHVRIVKPPDTSVLDAVPAIIGMSAFVEEELGLSVTNVVFDPSVVAAELSEGKEVTLSACFDLCIASVKCSAFVYGYSDTGIETTYQRGYSHSSPDPAASGHRRRRSWESDYEFDFSRNFKESDASTHEAIGVQNHGDPTVVQASEFVGFCLRFEDRPGSRQEHYSLSKSSGLRAFVKAEGPLTLNAATTITGASLSVDSVTA